MIRSRYQIGKIDLVRLLDMLINTPELTLENVEIVRSAARRYAISSADFADRLIEWSSAAAGCIETVTFDEGAAELSGMRLL